MQEVSRDPSNPTHSEKHLGHIIRGEHMVLPSISVVVPALNEAQNIPHVFSRIPLDMHEVILVDGYSIDDTVAVARRLRPEVRVVRQTRMGKGNALACGIAVATGDIVATVDADGSADPGEIPRFVDALLNGADFAKGSRFAEGRQQRHHSVAQWRQLPSHSFFQCLLRQEILRSMLWIQRFLAAACSGSGTGCYRFL